MLFNFGSFVGPKFEFNFQSDDVDTILSSFNDANTIGEYFMNALGGGVALAVVLSSIFSLLLTVLVICTLKAGGIRYFLKSRKNNPTDFKEVFQNFKDKTFLNIGKISFCKFGFTYLWSLLFVIPGIIKSYEYWAIDYIVATRPDIEREEAFRLSKVLMNGHKWDLFVLQLSFFGWNILNGFTSGILGVFYVSPYQQATYVEFFSDIRLEAMAKGAITPFDIPDYEYFAPEYHEAPYTHGFAQPNPQYNPQPFAQPVNPQPPFTPQAPFETPAEVPFEASTEAPTESPAEPPVEAPQSTVEAPIEANFEPVTPNETEE